VIYMEESQLRFHKSLSQLQEDTGEKKLSRAIAYVMSGKS
jgi:Cu-processing system ATP-binding protein